MISLSKFTITSICLLFLVVAISTAQETPQVVNYQGRLTDNAGSPVPDDLYTVEFTVYDAPSAGNIKWTELQKVNTTDGLFAVLLGANNPIDDTVFNQPSRYLAIKVGSDPELTPRTMIATVPYAYVARSAGPSTPIIWSGGCSSVSGSVGFNRYCTDVEDYNTTSGYLTVSDTGLFTVETAGFYRINAWTGNESSNAGLVRVEKNGSNIHETIHNSQGVWNTISADITWYFDIGDSFSVFFSTNDDYAFYSYDGNCCYSRLQVTYEGP